MVPKEGEGKLLFLEVLHGWGDHQFLLIHKTGQVLHDGNVFPIEQFPEAVDQTDLEAFPVNAILPNLKLPGLSHPDGETTLAQFGGEPFHLGTVSPGLLAHGDDHVGLFAPKGFGGASQGFPEGFNHGGRFFPQVGRAELGGKADPTGDGIPLGKGHAGGPGQKIGPQNGRQEITDGHTVRMLDQPVRLARIVVVADPGNEELLVAENPLVGLGLEVEAFDCPVEGYGGRTEGFDQLAIFAEKRPSLGRPSPGLSCKERIIPQTGPFLRGEAHHLSRRLPECPCCAVWDSRPAASR